MMNGIHKWSIASVEGLEGVAKLENNGSLKSLQKSSKYFSVSFLCFLSSMLKRSEKRSLRVLQLSLLLASVYGGRAEAQVAITPPQTTVTQGINTLDNPFANTIGPYTTPQAIPTTQYTGSTTTVYPGYPGTGYGYPGTSTLPGYTTLPGSGTMGPGPNGPPQFRQILPTYGQEPPKPLPQIDLRRPEQTIAMPAFGPYYTFPGLVGSKRGAWVGSDYLYNIPFNIKIIVEIVMPEGKLIPLQQASIEKRVTRIFEENNILTMGVCNNCGLGSGVLPPPVLPSAPLPSSVPSSPYTGGQPVFRSFSQGSPTPIGSTGNTPGISPLSSPIGSTYGGPSIPYSGASRSGPLPQINLPRRPAFDQPALPFFHVLIIPLPLENRYVACCSGRLFEAVKLDRIDFKTQGVIQAITWEKQALVTANKDEFEDVVDGAVDHIARSFVERLLFYYEIQEDLKERRRYYN